MTSRIDLDSLNLSRNKITTALTSYLENAAPISVLTLNYQSLNNSSASKANYLKNLVSDIDMLINYVQTTASSNGNLKQDIFTEVGFTAGFNYTEEMQIAVIVPLFAVYLSEHYHYNTSPQATISIESTSFLINDRLDTESQFPVVEYTNSITAVTRIVKKINEKVTGIPIPQPMIMPELLLADSRMIV